MSYSTCFIWQAHAGKLEAENGMYKQQLMESHQSHLDSVARYHVYFLLNVFGEVRLEAQLFFLLYFHLVENLIWFESFGH